eukprot:CFRG3691T1
MEFLGAEYWKDYEPPIVWEKSAGKDPVVYFYDDDDNEIERIPIAKEDPITVIHTIFTDHGYTMKDEPLPEEINVEKVHNQEL